MIPLSIVKDRITCEIILYKPVLSTKAPTNIAPTTPAPSIIKAIVDNSAGEYPNGSKRFDIRAPMARTDPNGSANAILSSKKFLFLYSALKDYLKSRAS